ncbi:replication protein [Achromobacter marplatensis]|uniref:Replication protein n=1 Tax=Achromobacter marplatensis TaxID=470868 RepID=A0AA43B217_9BURK|nr:replication protein [Achromobacter marplatensis]MDH2052550.1 replication protein [Achromobacter marplatensis]
MTEAQFIRGESSSPQVEDGHTRIANELLEAMCRAGFSARQWAVVMAVVRKTYGYGKKADDIGLSQLEHMTGVYKTHLSKTVRELVAANVIRREVGTFGHRLSLNKRFTQWCLGKGAAVTRTVTPVTESVTPETVTKTVTGVTESVTLKGVTDSVTQGLPIQSPQKETLQKKEKHPPIPPKGEESDPEGFAEAWAVYPKRQGGNPRGTAVKAWKARLRSGVAATEMIAGVRGYVAHCRAEGKVGTSFVMMAATFFGPDLRFRDFSESRPGQSPQGASRSVGVVPGSPLDIDTSPTWLAQTGYASVWEAISDGCTQHTYRWFRDGKRIPKEAA